jgi:uncharacterized Rossmann fold enzyme
VSALRLPEFEIPGALSWEERKENCEHALLLDLPRLKDCAEKPGFLTIACYGPSLTDTWRDMRQPILSVSGAHDWLIRKGVIPRYHVEVDPRPHKAKMLTLANDTTEYVIASCCHSDVFKALEGRKVVIWHLDNGRESRSWASMRDPGTAVISGGSTAGLRAFEVAHALGYRALDVHGMDCSFRGKQQWAGEHSGKLKPVTVIKLDGSPRLYETDPLMIQAAREAVKFWRTHDVPMKVRGTGLMQSMMRECQKGLIKPWARSKAKPQQEVWQAGTFTFIPSR